MTNKEYLGDSVYIQVEDGRLVLTTENGGPPSNIIYLEPEVIEALSKYIKKVFKI